MPRVGFDDVITRPNRLEPELVHRGWSGNKAKWSKWWSVRERVVSEGIDLRYKFYWDYGWGNDYKLQSSFGGRIFMGSNVSQSVAILPTCITPMQCRLMGSWIVCSSIRFYICSRYTGLLPYFPCCSRLASVAKSKGIRITQSPDWVLNNRLRLEEEVPGNSFFYALNFCLQVCAISECTWSQVVRRASFADHSYAARQVF